MGIASFSPSLHRSPSLSMILAPAQALVAFFMPMQPAPVSHQPLIRSPLPRMSNAQAIVKRTPDAITMRPVSRLKVMREFEPGHKSSHAGRMVISGRMADVCAELERIALKESHRP